MDGPRVGAVCLAVMGMVCAGCERSITDRDIVQIGVQDVQRLVGARDEPGGELAVLLIDPRSPARFEAEHLPGARNLQTTDVDEELGPDPEIQQFEALVVYGEDPTTAIARAMAKALMGAGYDGVRHFVGGLKDWKAAGLPVEQSPSTQSGQP